MKTTAHIFLAHCKAGLILIGRNEFKEPMWNGTPTQWNFYQNLIVHGNNN